MNLAGPMERRFHDCTLYLQIDVNVILPAVLTYLDGNVYCVYRASGYSARAFLYFPFSDTNMSTEEHILKKVMSGSQVNVQWYFREIKQLWTSLDFIRKLRVQNAGMKSLYTAGFLRSDFRNCVYPYDISKCFRCAPPDP